MGRLYFAPLLECVRSRWTMYRYLSAEAVMHWPLSGTSRQVVNVAFDEDDKNLLKRHCEETSSPPSSMPSPATLPSPPCSSGVVPLEWGIRLSKLSLLRASFAASGVLALPGVRQAA
jgi:hypothetical protein